GEAAVLAELAVCPGRHRTVEPQLDGVELPWTGLERVLAPRLPARGLCPRRLVGRLRIGARDGARATQGRVVALEVELLRLAAIFDVIDEARHDLNVQDRIGLLRMHLLGRILIAHDIMLRSMAPVSARAMPRRSGRSASPPCRTTRSARTQSLPPRKRPAT